MDDIIDGALDLANIVEEKKEEKPKRRVGRPRKVKIDQVVTIFGVVDKPKSNDNVMELICHEPAIFRKTNALLKNYDVADVTFIFRKDTVSIATEDFGKNSKIFITIKCSNLFWYYLKPDLNQEEPPELKICLKRTDVDEIFNTIDKTYDRLSMWVCQEKQNANINFSLHHVGLDDDQRYVVFLKQTQGVVTYPDIDCKNDYPIRFTLPTRTFKQKIEKLAKSFTKMTIKKESKDSPLTFEAKVEHEKEFETVFNDNEKISLIDNTTANDVISVSLMTGHIILLAKTIISENIHIWVDNEHSILFRTSISKVCDIDVFTKINEH